MIQAKSCPVSLKLPFNDLSSCKHEINSIPPRPFSIDFSIIQSVRILKINKPQKRSIKPIMFIFNFKVCDGTKENHKSN